MLKIERVGKRLISFRNLRPRPIADLYELADFIVNSPEEFFGEVGEDLFIIGTQVALSSTGPIAPVLAVDRLGCAVIASLDPPDEGSPLFHGMAAAGRVALWEPTDFRSRLTPERSQKLTDFLGPHAERLNEKQRIFLIAESFDDAMLTTASWLRDRYGIDAVCVEVALGLEPTSGDEYLSVADGQRSLPRAPSPHDAPTRVGSEDATPPAPAPRRPAPPSDDAPRALGPQPVERPRDERRAHSRIATESTVDMYVEFAGRRMGAKLRDYGDGGVGFVMQHPLPIGSRVRVQGEMPAPDEALRFHKAGRVQYCRFVNRRFLIGVAFDSPNHLAEPVEAEG